MTFGHLLFAFTSIFDLLSRFLNDVCRSSQSELHGKMMTASPNDVCLTAHWANITSLCDEGAIHHCAIALHHFMPVTDSYRISPDSIRSPVFSSKIQAKAHRCLCAFS